MLARQSALGPWALRAWTQTCSRKGLSLHGFYTFSRLYPESQSPRVPEQN